MSDRTSLRVLHRGFADRMHDLTPADEDGSALARRIAFAEGMAVLWAFHLNSRLIERFCGDRPARWDPSKFPWIADIEAAWPEIRAEVVAYLEAGTMPHTAEVSGLDPYSKKGLASVPADRGAWRTVVLQFFGDWIEENCQHFPASKAAMSGLRSMTSIGFTALDPHSHIAEHIGPNRGALRYQLPIIVPGAPGSCRIRVADEMVEWHEGESVVFDLAVNHEAWNDSDETRVLLMIEVPTPLPFPLGAINRFVQSCYRFFPSYRRLPARARQLAVGRVEALRDGHPVERYPVPRPDDIEEPLVASVTGGEP